MTNQCPFCGNYAYSVSVGASYRLDCRYCEIQIEITKRAYAARCPNPVAVLDYIKEKMKASSAALQPKDCRTGVKNTVSPKISVPAQ